MDWHLFTFTQVVLVARKLVGHLLDTKTSPEESSCFSILWEDQVMVFECGSSTYARSFFSELSHIERYSTLSLSSVVHLISLVHGYHGIEHL